MGLVAVDPGVAGVAARGLPRQVDHPDRTRRAGGRLPGREQRIDRGREAAAEEGVDPGGEQQEDRGPVAAADGPVAAQVRLAPRR